MDRRFSRGGMNCCRGPSSDESGTDFRTTLDSHMEIKEKDFASDEEKTVEITKF